VPEILLIPYTDIGVRWPRTSPGKTPRPRKSIGKATLAAWTDPRTYAAPSLIILDEVHTIRNGFQSAMGGGLAYMLSLAKRQHDHNNNPPARVWGLTATPTPNGRPRELMPWLLITGIFDRDNPLAPCSRYEHDDRNPRKSPEPFPRTVKDYAEWFCRQRNPDTPQGYDDNGAKNLPRLRRFLKACDQILQRLPKDVPGQLPALQRIVVRCPRPPQMKPEVHQAEYAVREQAGDPEKADPNDEASYWPDFEEMSSYRAALSLVKAAAAIEWVKESWAVGSEVEPLVLFVWHSEAGQHLAQALSKASGRTVEFASGGDTVDERQAKIDRFADSEGAPFLVASMAACGTGMNGMQKRTSSCVFVEYDWSEGTLNQAEGRIRRVGGLGAEFARAYYLAIDDLFDAHIADTLVSKRGRIKEVFSDAVEAERSVFNVDPTFNAIGSENREETAEADPPVSPLTARWRWIEVQGVTMARADSEGHREWMGQKVPVIAEDGRVYERTLGACVTSESHGSMWTVIEGGP